MDMILQREETEEWFEDFPHCHDFFLQGYVEAISDMTESVLTDPRSSRNMHVVNNNFEKEPIYFMGFEARPEERLFILSCIYVFPQHRRSGFGTHLINSAKAMVADQGAIQVAVEEEKLSELDAYYKRHDFKTTGIAKKNAGGRAYVDYFWSGKPIQLIDCPGGTLVKPLN
ncbi:hypothetical protein BZG72_11155 [Salinivibrio sp. PR6]|uniref:GNAT family N-acetyltransferase n=1 Tax=Salinivibrio sp. PR6 TaxID=1909485 RepID=UPI0009CDBB1D|nr:GNAT family N-acetyltransferase [Salinivibrio sp. PR6]OOE81416.1 hypothetical protein BZG72_11155 [Salinivibrio sp. PR6]